jgi:hypothetical protein
VLNGDNIYVMNQSGETFVFKAAPQFELLASSRLNESTNSSVVIAGDALFLRTHQGLWSIGASRGGKRAPADD